LLEVRSPLTQRGTQPVYCTKSTDIRLSSGHIYVTGHLTLTSLFSKKDWSRTEHEARIIILPQHVRFDSLTEGVYNFLLTCYVDRNCPGLLFGRQNWCWFTPLFLTDNGSGSSLAATGVYSTVVHVTWFRFKRFFPTSRAALL